MSRLLAFLAPLLLACRDVAGDDAAGAAGAAGHSSGASVSRTRVTHQLAVTAPIRVGTPPQELRCLLDSGSSDLWVPSKRCDSCSNQHYFHADRSSTFLPHWVSGWDANSVKPATVHVSYGSGSIAGYWVEDTVAIGNVQLKNQSFVIVEDTDLPRRRSWDGICGLGWRSISEAGTPLYRHLQESGRRAIITLFPSGQSQNQAFLALGEVPESIATSITWVDAEPLEEGAERTFWVTTGGIAIHKHTPVPSRFLVDTGTNFLLAPASVFDAFVRSLLPPGLFEEHCSTDYSGLTFCDCAVTHSAEVLPVRVYLGGHPFVIEVPHLFQKVHARDGSTVCVLMVQSQAPSTIDIMSPFGDPLAPLGGSLEGPFGDPFAPMESSPGAMPPASSADGQQGGVFGDPFAPWASSTDGGGSPQMQHDPLQEVLGGLLRGPPPGEAQFGNMSQRSSAGQGEEGAAGQAMPGLAPFPGGMPFPFPAMPGFQMNDSDVIVEEVHPGSDGTICTERVEREHGKLVSDTHSCRKPSRSHPQVIIASPEMAGLPGQPQSFPRRLQYASDPTSELWILGGVFLERFVAIFDFDDARIGFAEPSDEARRSVRDFQVVPNFAGADQDVALPFRGQGSLERPSSTALKPPTTGAPGPSPAATPAAPGSWVSSVQLFFFVASGGVGLVILYGVFAQKPAARPPRTAHDEENMLAAAE